MKEDRPLTSMEAGIIKQLLVEPKGLFVGVFGKAKQWLLENNLIEHLGSLHYSVLDLGREKLAEYNSAIGVDVQNQHLLGG